MMSGISLQARSMQEVDAHFAEAKGSNAHHNGASLTAFSPASADGEISVAAARLLKKAMEFVMTNIEIIFAAPL